MRRPARLILLLLIALAGVRHGPGRRVALLARAAWRRHQHRTEHPHRWTPPTTSPGRCDCRESVTRRRSSGKIACFSSLALRIQGIACSVPRSPHRPDRVAADVVVNASLEGKHELNSFASSTPATDGKSVYVTFLAGEDMVVAAYDFRASSNGSCGPANFTAATAIAVVP